jgi:arginine exporter protein ArgO
MTDENRKRIAMACRIFTILWFVGLAVLEARYVISVFRQRPTVHHVLNTIYEEQIEGINFVLMLIFLIPGVFSWAVYRRFKRSY